MEHSNADAGVKPIVSSGSAGREDPDAALIVRVQKGEIGAFSLLVNKYRERLFSIIYNLTSNREDAADLTQETFIKAFSSLPRFRNKSNFYTWLYRIAINTTLSHLKKNRYKHFYSLEKMDEEFTQSELVEILASKTNSDKSALLNELQEKLNEALQKLSLKHRTVVILHEIEGMSHQEIATITNSTEGTVRSRLHYAKKELQSYLQDYLK